MNTVRVLSLEEEQKKKEEIYACIKKKKNYNNRVHACTCKYHSLEFYYENNKPYILFSIIKYTL